MVIHVVILPKNHPKKQAEIVAPPIGRIHLPAAGGEP